MPHSGLRRAWTGSSGGARSWIPLSRWLPQGGETDSWLPSRQLRGLSRLRRLIGKRIRHTMMLFRNSERGCQNQETCIDSGSKSSEEFIPVLCGRHSLANGRKRAHQSQPSRLKNGSNNQDIERSKFMLGKEIARDPSANGGSQRER